jgi:hypothetical protein
MATGATGKSRRPRRRAVATPYRAVMIAANFGVPMPVASS